MLLLFALQPGSCVNLNVKSPILKQVANGVHPKKISYYDEYKRERKCLGNNCTVQSWAQEMASDPQEIQDLWNRYNELNAQWKYRKIQHPTALLTDAAALSYLSNADTAMSENVDSSIFHKK